MVSQAVPGWLTNLSFPYYRQDIFSQQVGMNGSIYPVYHPKENNVNNVIVISASQTYILPCKLPQPKDETPRNFYREDLLNLELMKEKVREKGAQIKKVDNHSRQACWHFLRGYCERGDSCRFQHRFTDANNDSQKVFLSGLPPITEVSLLKQLSDLGCNVVSKQLSLHKSWPCICLGSPHEAQMLLQRGKISISGHTVEVLPWH